MADRNRDQWNYPSHQDWDQNSGWHEQDSHYGQRRSNYGDVNYGRDYYQDQNRNQGGYSRRDEFTGTGYRQENDDYNRESRYRRSDYGPNYGRGNYGRGNREGDYGQSEWGSMYGQSHEYGGYGSGYGNRYGTSGGYDSDRGGRRDYGHGYSGYREGRYDTGYGSGYGSGDYGRRRGVSDYDRNWDRDRSWWDKTADEVSSWFGDEEAERRRRMDRQSSGEHRGKGPKGYHRSDDRIREDVNDRLSDDPYLDASDIEVKVENNDVVLTGTVISREDKRRAEDLAERVSGVSNVENRLRVGSERLSVGGSTTNLSDTSGTRKGNITT